MKPQHDDLQLNQLLQDVQRLATQVEHAMALATVALQQRDRDLARKRLAFIAAIDDAQRAITAQTLILNASQAPITVDPRFVTTIEVIAGELKRISDHVENIAETVVWNAPTPQTSEELLRMAELTQQMLHTAVHVYE